MNETNGEPRCDLCGREVGELQSHHCIPRTRHSNRRNKRHFTRQEVHERRLLLCRACHATIHATLTEKELERRYNTLSSLRSHSEIAAFVEWVRTQPADRKVTVRRTARRRDLSRAHSRRRKR